MQTANPDQPAHPRMLIRLRCSQIRFRMIHRFACTARRLYSDCADARTDSGSCCSRMRSATFSHDIRKCVLLIKKYFIEFTLKIIRHLIRCTPRVGQIPYHKNTEHVLATLELDEISYPGEILSANQIILSVQSPTVQRLGLVKSLLCFCSSDFITRN